MRSSVAAARLLFLLLWLLVMTKSSGGGLVHFHFLVFIIFKESNCCAPSAFALLRFVGTVQAAVQCARGLAEAKDAEIAQWHLFIGALQVFDDCHRESSLVGRR